MARQRFRRHQPGVGLAPGHGVDLGDRAGVLHGRGAQAIFRAWAPLRRTLACGLSRRNGGFAAYTARDMACAQGQASIMIDLAVKFAPLTAADDAHIEKLDERAFGPGRYARTAYRLREGVEPDRSLSFVARIGTLLVGVNRMTPDPRRIDARASAWTADGRAGVSPAARRRDAGQIFAGRRARGRHMASSCSSATRTITRGWASRRVPRGKITMPGPVDPDRLLYCELRPGALAETNGGCGAYDVARADHRREI